MVCCGMYGMVGFGCDMRCDGADGLAGLSTDALLACCAGWLGARDDGALGAALREWRWVLRLRRLFGSCVGFGFWRTRR